MSALPRPELAPGPSRTLNDALHDLHHRAGWPSLRTLAKETGVSHTTVSKAMSSTTLPSWGTLELLVEAMDGTVAEFHQLWLAASTPTNGTGPTTPRIAGRKAELDVVRRHLETGTGLLLVTGEAGIGKTRLVTEVVDIVEPVVAVGHCHQMSTEVPLMPVAEMLRSIHQQDEGQWLTEALADCPPYVRDALARVLPELSDGTPTAPADEFARQRMFSAVSAVFTSVGALRPVALLLEDIHWADPTTFDLLDHLLDRATQPLVATVRTHDPDADASVAERIAQLRRRSAVAPIALAPLDRAGTFDQLALALGHPPDEQLVETIHSRSQGLPLFVEQLASAEGDTLPDGLADLLDARLGALDGDDWSIIRALGVADRPLPTGVLGFATDMDIPRMVSRLRGLAEHRLVGTASGGDSARLRHPLLAEAVRRRLVPGEARMQHRQLAIALAQQADAEPGEVAQHWQGAGDAANELVWRTRAAERADERFAAREAFESWSRALVLWPSGTSPDIGHDLADVLSCAIDAARRDGQVDRALELGRRIRDVGAGGLVLADLLRQTGELLCMVNEVPRGMPLLDEAMDVYSSLPASPGLIRCLDARASTYVLLGSYARARADIDRALEVAAEIGAVQEERQILGWASWLALADGHPVRARELSHRALAGAGPADDPFLEVTLGVNATDILLHLGAPVAEVDATAERGLSLAGRWGVTMRLVGMLRCNVSQAHLRGGDVQGALDVLLDATAEAPSLASYDAQAVRVAVDTARGLLDEATARGEALDALDHRRDANWAETQLSRATADVWAGRRRDALTRLEDAAACLLATDNARLAAPGLALTARAAADARDKPAAARLRAMVAEAVDDPFGPRAIGVAAPAWRQVWDAELLRLDDADSTDGWARPARAWDGLHRPHDAAYCRWRAAQCALREGRGTVAARLLKKAAADAHEHVPLSEAIAETARAARAPSP